MTPSDRRQVDDLVKQLLDESTDDVVSSGGSAVPPLVSVKDSYSNFPDPSFVSAPQWVSRLYSKKDRQSANFPTKVVSHVPISLRSSQVIQAKAKRMEALVKQKEIEERPSGTPSISAKSKKLASKRIVDYRAPKKVVGTESTLPNYSFQPEINPNSSVLIANAGGSKGSAKAVTHRLMRDAERRRRKREEEIQLRESQLLAQCRPVPEISAFAKHLFGNLSKIDESVVCGEERIQTPVVSFQEFLDSRRKHQTARPPSVRLPPVPTHRTDDSFYQPNLSTLDLSGIFEFTKGNLRKN